MHNQYFPGDVVRNHPGRVSGEFKVYTVQGHVLDMVEVKPVDPKQDFGNEFFRPDQIEKYQITNEHGNAKLGDTVVLVGKQLFSALKSEFTVISFFGSEDDPRVELKYPSGGYHWASANEIKCVEGK